MKERVASFAKRWKEIKEERRRAEMQPAVL